MRHGIAAEPYEFKGTDRERPLTPEGMTKTAGVARSLVAFMAPTVVISSDLVRAVQTAELVIAATAAASGKSPNLYHSTALRPEADFADWRTFVATEMRTLCSAADVVLLVGHMPTISEYFCRHLGVSQDLVSFKKAGIGIIKPITMERGILVGFFPPKSLRG